MCTVVILRRPGHAWPVIIGANRDEAVERSWRAPGRHWPDRPDVVAGLDELAGGSWLGLNDTGVVAAILNRRHSLGPAEDKRSRGELVLEALDHADADAAAAALGDLAAPAYRPFNMIIADNRDAFWLRSLGDRGDGRVEVHDIDPGLSLVTAWDLNDRAASDRTRHFLPRFETAPAPDPDAGDWRAWEDLLASRERAADVGDPNGAMTVVTEWGFATVSRALIALPAGAGRRPTWRFQRTWPAPAPYAEVTV
jgi:uncharacterized protein with NRDE domain